MIPLTDTEPNRYSNFPFMTVLLISMNVLVLAFQETVYQIDPMFYRQIVYLYGAVPAWIWYRQGLGAVSVLSSLFLHGSIFHLISNMLALWVFGRRVEDACGPWRFLVYYLFCGATAVSVSTILRTSSNVPTIGASGAIAGLMGAYLLLFPWGRIRTLVFLNIFPIFPKIRAFWIILYFMALQIMPAIRVLLNGADYGIDYWAHIGGFFACMSIFLFLRPEALHRYRTNLPV